MFGIPIQGELFERDAVFFYECYFLIYPNLLLQNLSSASIDLVILIFLPLSSFFNMFADLMNLFLSLSFAK